MKLNPILDISNMMPVVYTGRHPTMWYLYNTFLQLEKCRNFLKTQFGKCVVASPTPPDLMTGELYPNDYI